MPNFHTKEFIEPTLPVSFAQTRFKYAAYSEKEQLIMCECSKHQFFVKIYAKGDYYLIKGDKITRPTQVSILQQALRDLRDVTKTTPHNSNIDAQRQRTLKVSPFLKEMEYFAHEFTTKKDILVEVGFGSGRHLLHQAKKNPDKLIIGLEIHKPSIEQVLKQCELQNISNILVVDYDARAFLEFLASNSVNQIFVHFPVPWDKKPHRRVISSRFINESKRVLKKSGTLELRTDSDKYFEYSFGEFIGQTKTELQINKNRDLEVSSKYEDRWKRQEKNIYDITMINQEDSEDIESIKTLKFNKKLNFKRIRESFEKKLLRGIDSFAHLEEIYDIDENRGLIRVSFGGGQKNEHNYIYISKDKVCYLPDNVLATQDNKNAHQLIEEMLWNM